MILKFKRVHPEAILPAYAHPSDAGMDVRSVEDLIIPAGHHALVRTGLIALLPRGYEIQVRPRSGLALKFGVTVLNSPGTIDAGYRGEIAVILANFGTADFAIAKGDRIAQFIVASVMQPTIAEAEFVDETDRGEGGFGSTGK